MNIKSFNTGRTYTANGQRISYLVTDSGYLIFWDHSRHVEGAMRWDHPHLYSEASTQRALMTQYDDARFWDETCHCMEAIGRSEYYRLRDTLRADGAA